MLAHLPLSYRLSGLPADLTADSSAGGEEVEVAFSILEVAERLAGPVEET